MPLDISKLRIDLNTPSAVADATEKLKSLALGLPEGSFATSKLSADIERMNRTWDQINSPLIRWYDEQRLLSESVSSRLAPLTEGSSVLRMAEQMRRLTEGVGAQLKVLAEDSATMGAFKEADRVAEAFRSTYAFDQRALGLAALPQIDVSRYTLPAYDEVGAISRMLEEQIAPLSHFSASISAAMEGMRSPWLSLENPLISATAFAELQTVGRMVGSRAPFGIDLSSTLRGSLGDWRDPVPFVPQVQPHEARARLYADRGLRQELVEFPDVAFDESMVLADLVPLTEEIDSETSAGLHRTRIVQSLLLELEVRLRRVIDDAMTEAFGPMWMLGRTTNDMADKWADKRDRDPLAQGLPLVEYADFTDYALIVLRKDNWAQVFRHIFGRREADVRESLQRLQPARVTAYHNRPLGRDDYLVAAVELRRLLLAVSRRRS